MNTNRQCQKVIVLVYEVTRNEKTDWNIIDTESFL